MAKKPIPAWQRNGTRRPFPSLWKAREMYGAKSVDYSAPKYERENQCPWCGGDVNNPRRRYCSEECAKAFQNATVWQRGRDAYSLRILYRDNFTCQDCGAFHAVTNHYGMTIPIDDGQLQVHHIKPVAEDGGDEPENLITLCRDCHRERHRQLRMEGFT